MSVVQNVLRVMYVQYFVFGIAVTCFQDQFLAHYGRSDVAGSQVMKNTMTWWGIAMLSSGMAGAAISQCGDYAIRSNRPL